MTKLFILGNGFDLSQGINTSCSDLKSYLIEMYSIDNANSSPDLPTPIVYPDDSERYVNTEVTTYIVNLINIPSSYNECPDL